MRAKPSNPGRHRAPGFFVFAIVATVVASVTVDAASLEPPALTDRQQLLEARKHLRTLVSDCNGVDILVRACPGRVPPPKQTCSDPVAPCSIVEALRATNVALVALDTGLKP